MAQKLRVGYCRVSTGSGEQLAALERQRPRLQAAGVDLVIEDIQSGKESDRAGYMELLDLIERGRVSEVVITRVDRLGRDAADTDAVIAFAAKRGVKLTALDGGAIESETPSGFVMSRIMTTMAEMESRMLSLRIKAGLEQARREGRPTRGRAPWGYQLKPDRSGFELDPIEAPRATAFLALMEQEEWNMTGALWHWKRSGLGPIPLNTVTSIRGWLSNPVLRGGIGYKRNGTSYDEVVWNCHSPLINQEQFALIEQKIKQNCQLWGYNFQRPPKLLTGLCRCGHCGRGMSYAGRRQVMALICANRNCEQCYKSIRESIISVAINTALSASAQRLAGSVAEEPPEAIELRSAIAALEALNDPDLELAIENKRNRMRNLHKQSNLDPHLIEAVSQPGFWKHYSPEELRELYVGLVAKVTIRAQKVHQVLLRR